jgi:hypothetical protein
MRSKSIIGSAAAVIARFGRVLSIAPGKRLTDPAACTGHLWAGIDRKLEAAQISLHEMARSLSPARTTMTVVQQSTGAIIGHRWERIYEHVDTFLAKARSVPEIIESCFGADRVLMQTGWWCYDLSDDERARRKKFSRKFRKEREKFSTISPWNDIPASTDLATPMLRAR